MAAASSSAPGLGGLRLASPWRLALWGQRCCLCIASSHSVRPSTHSQHHRKRNTPHQSQCHRRCGPNHRTLSHLDTRWLGTWQGCPKQNHPHGRSTALHLPRSCYIQRHSSASMSPLSSEKSSCCQLQLHQQAVQTSKPGRHNSAVFPEEPSNSHPSRIETPLWRCCHCCRRIREHTLQHTCCHRCCLSKCSAKRPAKQCQGMAMAYRSEPLPTGNLMDDRSRKNCQAKNLVDRSPRRTRR